MTRLCFIAAILFGDAFAGRPPPALLADRAAAEAEVHDLERRARSLGEQAGERKERLKLRLRALYKLSNGGSLRLLFTDAALAATRHEAIRRILARDLEELAAIREEALQVDAEQARRQDAMGRALDLDRQIASTPASEPTGLAAQQGHLRRPVPGPILRSFGSYRESGVELARRGAELQSSPGQAVRSVAAARVAWVGEAPGVGPAVALDHGDGYVTLYGRLRPSVSAGELVSEGAVLGHALGTSLFFELAQEGTPLDPAPWMQRPQ
jgi:septal ring factor EnvC (AmiA/AmiB activator)